MEAFQHSPRCAPHCWGGGITPIYSLAKGILSTGGGQTRIHLIWGVNGTRDIVLKDDLEALENQYPKQLQVTYIVSGPEGKPDTPSLGGGQKYKRGHVNQAILHELIGPIGGQNSLADETSTKVFLYGPPAMGEAIAGNRGVLNALGITKKEIHKF